MKENIKAPRHWPLWGEFTGDRWIPRTKGQLRGKCSHLMTSSWWFYPQLLRRYQNARRVHPNPSKCRKNPCGLWRLVRRDTSHENPFNITVCLHENELKVNSAKLRFLSRLGVITEIHQRVAWLVKKVNGFFLSTYWYEKQMADILLTFSMENNWLIFCFQHFLMHFLEEKQQQNNCFSFKIYRTLAPSVQLSINHYWFS